MTDAEGPDVVVREKVVRWEDPLAAAQAGRALSGREHMQAMADGRIPPPPIAQLMGFGVSEVGEGAVTFFATPDESAYNPIGMVHGGYVCTLLDSALGCAVHTTLPVGVGYTSIEIKVNYLRAVHAGSGRLEGRGRVTKPGRRVAFAEGEVVDAAGRLLATAQSSFLIVAAEA